MGELETSFRRRVVEKREYKVSFIDRKNSSLLV